MLLSTLAAVLALTASSDQPGDPILSIGFTSEARVRLDGAGLPRSTTGADLGPLRAIAAAAGLTFEPLIQTPEETLRALEQRALLASGQPQADLAGFLRIKLEGAGRENFELLAQSLAGLPQVAWVHVDELGAPPPGDIAPTTPDLESLQTYLGGNPGVNALFAFSQLALGSGVRLSDCEYGWITSHEDLVDVTIVPEPGQTPASFVAQNGWDQHGTAVLGQIVAPANGYGVTGMARGVQVYTFPEWTVQQGARRVTAITNAIAGSAPGDVVLLEMQTAAGGPAELDPAIHSVVRAGVAAGVIVVGAAGNGNQNLDSAAYQSYLNLGDSGAILVGAGSANSSHNKLFFSTYGSRVNVQAWGESVMTLGYGSFATYGGDNNQKYGYFSGTSSASPFVASAAAVLSGLHQQYLGSALSPTAIRNLLIQTGSPQGAGGKIGPLVDFQAAIDALDIGFKSEGQALLGSGATPPELQGSGILAFGTPFSLTVAQGPANGFGFLVVGSAEQNLPLLGGVLVPTPDELIPLLLNGSGKWTLASTLNLNQPGTLLWLQAWLIDPPAASGVAATNALRATLH